MPSYWIQFAMSVCVWVLLCVFVRWFQQSPISERKMKWNIKRNWKRQIQRLYFVIKRERGVLCEMQKKMKKNWDMQAKVYCELDGGRERVCCWDFFFSFPFRKGIYIYMPYRSCLSLSPIIHGMDTIISICAQNYYVLLWWHSSGDGEWKYAWTSITAIQLLRRRWRRRRRRRW